MWKFFAGCTAIWVLIAIGMGSTIGVGGFAIGAIFALSSGAFAAYVYDVESQN